MQSTRGSYYSQVVNEYQSDQRIENFLELLTTCMPNLIYHILPTALQVLKLANCFINVFVDKIDTIHRDDLVERCPQDSLVYEDTPVRSSSLDFFADVPIDDLFSMARPMAKRVSTVLDGEDLPEKVGCRKESYFLDFMYADVARDFVGAVFHNHWDCIIIIIIITTINSLVSIV